MLDVHPARQPATTWREFLVHIATIVVGLLIAIGLEQTVVWVDHRRQLAEARQDLSNELKEKQRLLQLDKQQLERVDAELSSDMEILIAHRSRLATDAPKLDYSWQFNGSPEGAWDSVKQTGALRLMSHEDVQRYSYAYDLSARMQEAASTFLQKLAVTQAIAKRSPDGELSPHDIDELISATSECQGDLAFTSNLLSYTRLGLSDADR